MRRPNHKFVIATLMAVILLGLGAWAQAHPMVENAIDIVIDRSRITVDARISQEQILLAELKGVSLQSADQWPALIQRHAAYLREHLHMSADGQRVSAGHATAIDIKAPTNSSSLVAYRIEYLLTTVPKSIQFDQNFLKEFQWSATCVIRVRLSTEPNFETGMLPADTPTTYDCEWPATATTASAASALKPIQTSVHVGSTIRAYTAHGIMHILTGYDHLLFVSALVLAATGIWDLIKVVSAFTLAHTLTLTLSVFNIVNLSEHIVEPMIAASIVFVAVQNVFWPKRSRGWTRLAIAFAFGLFHGLGFAGGLKDAMADMPSVALWAALIAFSVGVELGHQIVVLPLFAVIQAMKNFKAEVPRIAFIDRLRQVASIFISIAGIYYFAQAVK